MNENAAFDSLRGALDVGRIHSMEEMFAYVPMRTLFKSAGLNPYGFAIKRVADPTLFKIQEIYALAAAIGVSGLQVLKIVTVEEYHLSRPESLANQS